MICAGRCGRELIPAVTWHGLPADDRTRLASEGYAAHASRGLCYADYSRATKAGTLVDFERRNHTSDEVAEEWRHFATLGDPRNRNAMRVAERLGVPWKTVEKAMERRQRRLEEAS